MIDPATAVDEHLEALRLEGVRLAAAAGAAGLPATVSNCPGWVVRDLVRHTGAVHRWATAIVAGSLTEPPSLPDSPPGDPELITWFEDGHARLLATLGAADPELVCWTFLPAPSPRAMWARRQAHETAIHRVDAELSAGSTPTPCPAGFAADGIDELLAGFVARRRALRGDPPRTLHVRCTDVDDGWVVKITAERVTTTRNAAPAGVDCQLSGPASELYFTLWNRRDLSGLSVEGDRAVLAAVLDQKM